MTHEHDLGAPVRSIIDANRYTTLGTAGDGPRRATSGSVSCRRATTTPARHHRVAVAPESVLTSLRDEAAAVERRAEALGARILPA
jgi:hypothetical protein